MKIQPCSILLPIYNGSQFLKQSIDSNLETMRIEDELVVVSLTNLSSSFFISLVTEIDK